MASGFSGLIPYAVNFSVVAGAGIYYGRKPLKKFLYQRYERLKGLIDSAAIARKSSEDRFAKVMKSLESAAGESKKLVSNAETDARAEAIEILKKADQDSKRIEQDVINIIENEQQLQIDRIRQDIVYKALNDTEKKLRKEINDDTHTTILRAAQNQIEAGA